MTFSPVWHPVTTLLLDDPPCYASPQMVKILLMAGPTRLVYVGDSMWPSIPSRAVLSVERSASLERNDVVVVVDAGGVPIVARLVEVTESDVCYLADADPSGPWRCDRSQVLGTVRTIRMLGTSRPMRVYRRIRCDLIEVLLRLDSESGDPGQIDPADSVRAKYDEQAPHYQSLNPQSIPPSILHRVRRSVRSDGRILVVGSGIGRECFGLAELGWSITGIDFSKPMVELSRRRAGEQPQAIRDAVSFVEADLRTWTPDAIYDGIFFTFDVYSFIPRRADRIAVLVKLSQALSRDGTIFLSARRMRSSYERAVHAYGLLRGVRRGPWGASHTRYVDARGNLRRAFVQIFEPSQLRREIRAAGLVAGSWRDSYSELSLP